jgi:hypothetical protein
MKKILALIIVITTLTVCFTGCGNKNSDQVIATVNGVEIKMSEIEDDIKFVSKYGEVDMNDPKAVDAMILDILNTYLIDYMCNEELKSLGMTYNRDYYKASYASLVDAYGNEETLIAHVKSFGLNREYIENLCIKQARKATLSEYLTEEYKKNLKIEEADILQYYIENTQAFKTDEVRTFYFLTFKTNDMANDAIEDIKENGFMSYYDAQSTLQVCDYFGILEHYEKSYFPSSVSSKLFSMEVGTYTEPMTTFQDSGYTILYLSEAIKDYTFSYDEMKESIQEGLIEVEVDDYLNNFFKELNDKYEVNIVYGK